MRVKYVAGLKPQDGGFLVHFPQFPEIVTQGGTIAEAVDMARDALELVVEAWVDESKALPGQGAETMRDVWTVLVRDRFHPQVIEAIAPDSDPAERYNISMAPALMERVDRKAEETGKSRSAFIADALRDALAH